MLEVGNDFWIATDRGLFKVDKTTQASTHYSTDNSILPDNHIQTLSKDVAGNLWIGTYDLAMAMVPANGGNWSLVNYPTLPNNLLVYCSAVAPNGDIWVGCNQGLIQYDGQSWTHHPFSGISLTFGPVWDIAINSNGKVYAASFNLLSFENGQWHEHRDSGVTMSAYSDAYVCLQNDSTAWYLADAHRVYKFDGHNWENWEVFLDLPVQPSFFNVDMQMHNNGNVYYNGNDNLLAYYDGNQWQVDSSIYYQTTQLGTFGNISTFSLNSNGNFWAFSKNKHLKFENASAQVSELIRLDPFTFHTELHPDRNGVMHSLHYNYGIHRIDAAGWTSLPVSVGGSPIPSYTNLCFDMQNEKWFLTNIGGVLTVMEEQNGSWIQHNNTTSGGILPTSATIYNMVISSQNRLWISDSNRNVYEYYNGVWSAINVLLSYSDHSDFMADNNGNFWFIERNNAGNWYLKKHNGITLVNSYAYPQNNGILLKPAIDSSGNIWTTASNGNLYKFDGTSFSTVNYASASARPQTVIAHQDKIFVGTDDEGLYWYNGNNWAQVSRYASNLNDNDIRGLALDGQGNLWFDLGIGKVIDVWNAAVVSSTQSSQQAIAMEMQLFPNPCQDLLTVKTDAIARQLSILNLQGQILMQMPVQTNTVQLDMSELGIGMYWLRLETENGQVTKPFVKQ